MARVFVLWISFLSPNQQCQSIKGSTKHWPQPVAWPHPFFIHHRTSNRIGIDPFTLAFPIIHQTNIISQWRDEWKSAPVVNSSLVKDPAMQQPGFDLPRSYWALPNRFWTNQGHRASCWKKWGLAATDMCPCGKRQTMSHIVNSCPQSKLEGAAVIALSWRCCYRMAEDIQLVNALDNNNWLFEDWLS